MRAALGEMAGIEIHVRATAQETPQAAQGCIAAVLRLESATVEFIVLSFPERTAAALTARILAEVGAPVDAVLIRDCVGEIANVAAGQAKALLADTPHRFAFLVPEVVADEPQPRQGSGCVAIAFTSDHGDFLLQLFLKTH